MKEVLGIYLFKKISKTERMEEETEVKKGQKPSAISSFKAATRELSNIYLFDNKSCLRFIHQKDIQQLLLLFYLRVSVIWKLCC